MAVTYKPILYIAGPMRGYPDFNHPSFFAVASTAESLGWRVINPAILPTDLPDSCYMPICLAMLEACDAIYVLPGSENSTGAKAEIAYAAVQGITELHDYDDLVREYALYQHEPEPQQLSFEVEATND